MADESFVKIYCARMLTSSAMHLPPEQFKVFVTLLLMADKDGHVASTAPGIAARAILPLSEVEKALEVLSAPDKYSRNATDEGRRIRAVDGGYFVINRGHYRDYQSPAQKQTAERQRAFRARHADKASEALRGVNATPPGRDVTPPGRDGALHNAPSRAEDRVQRTEKEVVSPSGCSAGAPTTAPRVPPGAMQEVVDAWNAAVAQRPGWCACRRIPKGEVGAALAARCRDPTWMAEYPEALNRMRSLAWMKRAKLETFLRPDTVRKILDEEWRNDESKDLFEHHHPSAGVL